MATTAPVKKKKKTISTALVVPTKRRISKLKKDKDFKSIIGDHAEEIQQLLEDGNSDSATIMMQKRLLQSLADLIPLAENTIRKSEGARGVYQFNSLVVSLRELLIDMQQAKDRGALGDALVEKIIRPAFLDIGMQLVQEDARVTSDMKVQMEADTYKAFKRSKEASLQRLAEFIQKQYGQVKDQSVRFLQR